MWVTAFIYVFTLISLINIVHLGLYLVGANYYDIIGFRREKKKQKRLRHAPRVSVLIPAHNEELSIIRCIDSVRKSTIRNLEIVVIDDASTDRTVEIVTDYIRKNPDFNCKVRLLRRFENGGKASALNYALVRGLEGEFVMTLDADSMIHPEAIENATDYLIDDPKVAGVAANVRVTNTLTVLGLLQKFEYLVGYRSKKFYTMSNSEYIVGGVASTYRYETLKEVGFYDNDTQTEDIALSLKIASLGNRSHQLIYGADVLAMTEGVQTISSLLRQRYRWKLGSLQSLFKYRKLLMKNDERYSRALTWYRLPMAFLGELIVLIEPLMVVFIVYLSFLTLSLQSFIGAYILITMYLLWNIWPDEHMKITDKIRMTAYTPVMYFLFYIMNLVQLMAVLQCILNLEQVMRRAPTNAIWASPKRTGAHAVRFS